jgi:hypothetical protein
VWSHALADRPERVAKAALAIDLAEFLALRPAAAGTGAHGVAHIRIPAVMNLSSRHIACKKAEQNYKKTKSFFDVICNQITPAAFQKMRK